MGVGQPVAVQRAIEGAHESKWPSPPGAWAESVVYGELIWYQQLSLKPGEGALLGESDARDEHVGLWEQREPFLGAGEGSTGLAEGDGDFGRKMPNKSRFHACNVNVVTRQSTMHLLWRDKDSDSCVNRLIKRHKFANRAHPTLPRVKISLPIGVKLGDIRSGQKTSEYPR